MSEAENKALVRRLLANEGRGPGWRSPDAQATLEDSFSDGDRVVYGLTIRGTHTREFLGIVASGRQVAMSFIAIVRIVHGKLVGSGGAWTSPTSYGRCAAARPHPD